MFIVIEVIVHQCKRGHYSSLQSEVIVFLVIAMCVTAIGGHRSSMLSEVIVFIVIEVIVVTVIGGHRVHLCHRYHRYRGQNLSSLWS